jgi:periplasmic divalent cation tolerance protein
VLVDEPGSIVPILPVMTSVYRWKGRSRKTANSSAVIKTTNDRVDALEARFHELHPYELPEFLVIAATDASAGYMTWLDGSTRSER